MRRRTFLRVCTGVAITTATAAASRWGPWGAGGLAVRGRALFPGAPLEVHVADSAPEGATLRVAVRHAGREHVGQTPLAPPGGSLRVPTPYPFDELVPGVYRVSVALVDPSGRELERHDVGGYELARHRFSA